MSDLIDRQAAIDVVRSYYDPEDHSVESIEDRIKKIPSAQPERKKGRWIKKEERVYYWYECSECGAKPLWNEWRTDRCFSAFCPKCGADMRGEEDET